MSKQRRIIFFITILYTLLILYIIFLAFGRTDAAEQTTGYNLELNQ